MLLFHGPWLLPSGRRWQQETGAGCERANPFGKPDPAKDVKFELYE